MPPFTRFTLRAPLFATLLAAAGIAHADVELTDRPGVLASANSCYLSLCDVPGTFTARNAIDNQRYRPRTGGHGWSAGDHGTAGNPNWLRVDLGALFVVSSVGLRFHDNAGAWQGYSNDYQLRASSDGSTWTLLGSGTLVDLTGNEAALTDAYSWAGNARPLARWLEYRVVGGSHWSALDEIDAMGSAAPVPEPASYVLMALGLLGIGLHARRRR